MSLSSAALWLLLAYVGWSLLSFARNYRTAQKIGLPIVVSPVDALNPVWYLSRNIVGAVFLKLPSGLGGWAHRLQSHWTNQARYAMHAKYGGAFQEVTPSSVKVFVADPEAIEDIYKRYNDFIKSPFIYGALEVFGPNLDTVNGTEWARHRRITVPPFNEKNSALVWQESINQATDMLASWRNQDIVQTTGPDNSTLALNVLCLAGFGVETKFIEARTAVAATGKDGPVRLGYRQALRLLLGSFQQLLVLTLLTKIGVQPQWLWGSLKEIFHVRTEFKEYMTEMIADERKQYDSGNFDRHNLIAALIRADITAKKESETSTSTATVDLTEQGPATTRGLTEEEIFGNLFFYNLGGQETTASTITFALVLLALHPELQGWIGAEIDSVRASSSTSNDTHLSAYEATFPRLHRCLALMHETIRLYGPVPANPRETRADIATALQIQGRTYFIPPKTMVVGSFAAVHADPAIWGADALDFKPERFIVTAHDDTDTHGAGPAPVEKCREDVNNPAAGFVGWNRGPRICPGRKFSQVEFIAVLFVLFAGGSRVQLVRCPGEGRAAAERRARKALYNAELEVALKMAEGVPLRWGVGDIGDGKEGGVVG